VPVLHREAPSFEPQRMNDWSAIMTRNEKVRISETTCTASFRCSRSLALIISLLAGDISVVQAAVENPKGLEGAWRLSRQFEAEGEWATLELHLLDNKLIIEQIDAPFMAGINPTKGYVEHSGGALAVVITNGYFDLVFKALLSRNGNLDRIEGPLRLQSQLFAVSPTSMARLEKIPKYRKVDMKKNGQVPEPTPGLGEWLAVMAAMRKAVAEFSDPRYAPLDLKIAHAALRDLRNDATTEERVWAESRLLDAARRSDKADITKETQARLEPLKRLLAAEKQGRVEPLKPDPYPGRADPRHDCVVLLELFTGAECGPCVAADLAFDALSDAYRTTELITLEYHLHIPRPDPLTGPDTVARAAYYEVHSTPSTVFNGKAAAGSGGLAEHARKKLNQYRFVIDEILKNTKRAAIQLKAKRVGEQIQIMASAEILDEGEKAPAKLRRLRLVLVEENVAYLGGNAQSSHHHVVRAFPAGVEGTSLEGGKGRVETTVSLDKVREAQAAYLKAYPDSPRARGKFPRALPPVVLDHLSVVAVVQDDQDRTVLHAVVVPVEEAKASNDHESEER
jgi:hypothetical protein